MFISEQIAQFHKGPWIGAITEVGLGVPIMAALTRVDGCSKSFIFGNCPYDRDFQPNVEARSVSKEMAFAMAESNWGKLSENGHLGPNAFSLAVSGAFKEANERGETHAWVVLLTKYFTATMHFTIPKGYRRDEAIDIAGRTIFKFMAVHMHEGVTIDYTELTDLYRKYSVTIDVIEGPGFDLERQLEFAGFNRPLAFVDGNMVRVQDVIRNMGRIYRGSFNPPTKAHDVIGKDAVYEITLMNARKDRADISNIAHRIQMLTLLGKTVLITDGVPYFIDLDDLLQDFGASSDVMYVMGDDTYLRVVEPGQYDNIQKDRMDRFEEDAQIELVIGDQSPLTAEKLATSYWGFYNLTLSSACKHPDLIHRATPVREGGLDHIHSLPKSVQNYVELHNPYNFVEKT